jgi:phosphoribosylanthranilate isomerase
LKTWVKICGTTNLVDALAATEAGADAIGFVFAESARRVEPEVVRDIVEELPEELEKIGVFVNESPELVLQVARDAGLTGVQLQGDESADYVRTLAALTHTPLKIIKGVPAGAGRFEGLAEFAGVEELLDAVLLDSGSRAQRGGTGKTFDWIAASDVILKLQQDIPVIIAGGLNPENVTEAVYLFRPFGVDVVSGVEREPRHKDPERLKHFIHSVREADRAGSERKQ